MPWLVRRLLQTVTLLIGVTALCFLLMVRFGPDQTYSLVGKNASTEQIEEIRRQLGYDQPALQRYLGYLSDLVRLDLGRSQSTGEGVAQILQRVLPVTLLLVLPGFVLGNVLGVLLALLATRFRDSWADRLVSAGSIISMSLSFLVIVIGLQALLCTPYGLNLFPARGWSTASLSQYLLHVAVPTLALVLVTLGYNMRFYRAVLVEEYGRDHVQAARALGAGEAELLWRHVLPNSLLHLITRVMFSLPIVLVSGGLLLETFFGIPGLGQVTYYAITNGDQPVLLAVVSLTGILFVLVQFGADSLYRLADPRLQ